MEFIKNFDFISLQETWSLNSVFAETIMSCYTQYECNAKMSTVGGRHMGGVLLFVKQTFDSFVKRICEDFAFGIIVLVDKSLFGTLEDIIYCTLYLPPEGSPIFENYIQSALNLFEETLIENNLLGKYLIIGGDLNSRIGNEHDYIDRIQDNIPELREYSDILYDNNVPPRKSYDNVVNKSGKQLLKFCKIYNCFVVNGRCGSDTGIGDFTFINQNGCSVIDYFVLSASLFDIVSNFNIVSRPESCHMPITMELYYVHTTTPVESDDGDSKTFYNWNDSNIDLYKENIRDHILSGAFNNFDALVNDYESDINDVLNAFENVITSCSNEFKMKRRRKKCRKKDWFDFECNKSKHKVINSLKRFRASRSVEDLNTYITHKKIFKALCKSKRYIYEKQYISKIDSSVNNSKEFWKYVKNMTRKPSNSPRITPTEWYEHFKRLFSTDEMTNNDDASTLNNDLENDPIDETEDIILNSEITEEEVKCAINELKKNKSTSGILFPQHFKLVSDALLPYIIKFFNRLLSKGEFPQSWSRSIIVPVHKKGSIHFADNYRGIALLDTFSKIYISILTQRVSFYCEVYAKLSESQAGFRSSYSTIDNAFVLYSIISKYLSKKRKFIYVAFIDFQKAFDSVNRNILFDILRNRGINGKLLLSIQAVYKAVKASVKTNVHTTDSFDCPLGLRQGCSLSPVLFVLFINELYDLMTTNDVRGIQLYPDLTEIFLLMFADDIACISDTVSGLQKQLNILSNFCSNNRLKVNTQKTKVMVFKNGGSLSSREKWTYNEIILETVNGFSYVGVYFTNRLSLYKMAEAMSIKAQRILAHLFNSFEVLPCIPYKTFFKVFDSKVSTILLYGSEIWGTKPMTCIENVQVYACKRFLNVSPTSSNDAVLGDLSRFPLHIFTVKRCVKFWIRLLKLPNTRYSKKCYNMLKYFDSIGYKNWVTEIRQLLCTNGFGYVWQEQNVHNIGHFLSAFLQRLKDQHIQTWRQNLETNNKLIYYRDFKMSFSLEPFVSAIDITKFRTTLAKFRCSSHDLMIERGRYFNIPREERTCVYCNTVIEDELHFVMSCPLYENMRVTYIPEYFRLNRTRDDFMRLMSAENADIIRNLGMFLYYAFKLRSEFLAGQD